MNAISDQQGARLGDKDPRTQVTFRPHQITT